MSGKYTGTPWRAIRFHPFGMALIAAGLSAIDGRAAVLLRRLMVGRAPPASLAADKIER